MSAFGSSHAPSRLSHLEYKGDMFAFSHPHTPDSNPKIYRVALEIQFLLLIIFLAIRKYTRSQSEECSDTTATMELLISPRIFLTDSLVLPPVLIFFDFMLPHSIGRHDYISETEQHFPFGYYHTRFMSHLCICSPISPCLCNSCNPGVNAWRPWLQGYFQPPCPSSESLFFFMLGLLLEGILAGGSFMEVGRQ